MFDCDVLAQLPLRRRCRTARAVIHGEPGLSVLEREAILAAALWPLGDAQLVPAEQRLEELRQRREERRLERVARDARIVELAANGARGREIAAGVGVSEATVSNVLRRREATPAAA